MRFLFMEKRVNAQKYCTFGLTKAPSIVRTLHKITGAVQRVRPSRFRAPCPGAVPFNLHRQREPLLFGARPTLPGSPRPRCGQTPCAHERACVYCPRRLRAPCVRRRELKRTVKRSRKRARDRNHKRVFLCPPPSTCTAPAPSTCRALLPAPTTGPASLAHAVPLPGSARRAPRRDSTALSVRAVNVFGF